MKTIFALVMAGFMGMGVNLAKADTAAVTPGTNVEGLKPAAASMPVPKSKKTKAAKKKAAKETWVCPMGDYVGDKPGKCPKCGMDLEKVTLKKGAEAKDNKKTEALRSDSGQAAKKMYVCEMDGYTSDKPGKCPKCGMDLVEKK